MHSLTFKHMSKAYGGVPALSDVSLTLEGGKIHALMGENGAGKSTLIKLIAGVVPADDISVEIDGASVPITSSQDAHQVGFRFIHQELNIVPQISVAENILLGHRYPRRFGVAVDWKQVRAKARQALEFLGADHIDVTAFAGSLPPGDKMLIKIAAAFVVEEGPDAVLYVLDEPTAALTEQESEMLFAVIERLRNSGSAVLYVSHRMDEVLRICDHVTVLRDGKHVSTAPVVDTSMDTLIRDMTGREVRAAYPPRDAEFEAEIVAELNQVNTPNLHGLNFQLRKGEILGIAGLADAGQSELLRLFMGLEPVLSGDAAYMDHGLPETPSEAWAKHIAYIPRERRGDALMLDMPICSNIVLPHLGRYGAKASKKAETTDAVVLAEKVRLKYEGLDQPVGQLSGGNQQKVVFARALFGNPQLLLLEEPTRGVDVGAKYDIYLLVRELSAKGCAVILTSTDLPEILGMCDRILVLQDGRQSHLLSGKHLTSAKLLSHFYQTEAA